MGWYDVNGDLFAQLKPLADHATVLERRVVAIAALAVGW